MVNPAKIVAQIAVVGTQILARAFVEAYQQAAANAARQGAAGARAAVGVASGGGAGSVALTRRLNMTLEEAAQILNVDKQAGADALTQRYDVLFKANDPSKGGSFYLQSKIFRARERLELEFRDAQKVPLRD